LTFLSARSLYIRASSLLMEAISCSIVCSICRLTLQLSTAVLSPTIHSNPTSNTSYHVY
jgi:hypothetical protein